MTFDVTHVLSDAQIDQLVELFEREWWSVGRQRGDVVRMLAGTSLLVGITERSTQRLVGFARVLSDFVYKALILDLIVANEHRQAGLGKRLMDTILMHPQLASVRHFELYCRPEMNSYYERWGFSAETGALRLMRRENS